MGATTNSFGWMLAYVGCWRFRGGRPRFGAGASLVDVDLVFCFPLPVIIRVESLSVSGLMLISVFMPTFVYLFVFHDSLEHSIHRVVHPPFALDSGDELLLATGEGWGDGLRSE